MAKKEKNNRCFIVTPIGSQDSQSRRSADGLITTVIRPLLEEHFQFVEIYAAHEINSSGSINNQIMKSVLYDDLVIANLTGVNPNVMYEVAVRHATLKPIIHICEEGTKLPFDIIDQRTIFYKNDMLGVTELREKLKAMIEVALKEEQFADNPIYNASKSKIFEENIYKDPEKNFEKYLLERFDKLEARIGSSKYSSRSETNMVYIREFVFKIKTEKVENLVDFFSELNEYLSEYNWKVRGGEVNYKEFEKDNSIEIDVEVRAKALISDEQFHYLFNHFKPSKMTVLSVKSKYKDVTYVPHTLKTIPSF